MRTQVAIVGAGPAGLLLGALLHQAGIDSVVVERRSADQVLGQERCAVLEQATVDLLDEAGIGARLRAEAQADDGVVLAFGGRLHRIDLFRATGKRVVVCGQAGLLRDLTAARAEAALRSVYLAEDVSIGGFDGDRPWVGWHKGGAAQRLEADFIAGCDGFDGVCRASVPAGAMRCYETRYPFGWIGVLADVAPVSRELVYASHERGFALAGLRSAGGRQCHYVLQCALDDAVADWPDERFWQECALRLPPALADKLVTGPCLDKTVEPLRSFVAEPMRFGRLFLAGDAAHVVPPTGAKGLNLAAGDVGLLSRALRDFYAGRHEGLERYSERALSRAWRAQRFSCWLTSLTHRCPDGGDFAMKLQRAELDYLCASAAAQTSLAENCVGLPLLL